MQFFVLRNNPTSQANAELTASFLYSSPKREEASTGSTSGECPVFGSRKRLTELPAIAFSTQLSSPCLPIPLSNPTALPTKAVQNPSVSIQPVLPTPQSASTPPQPTTMASAASMPDTATLSDVTDTLINKLKPTIKGIAESRAVTYAANWVESTISGENLDAVKNMVTENLVPDVETVKNFVPNAYGYVKNLIWGGEKQGKGGVKID
ncbi:hypothetical protein BZA77DRAFT_294941 [Pyronema omphalodes]|nr:hypothetical protein BZA77DRAFT_294941 [Pyronema omphalodes]